VKPSLVVDTLEICHVGDHHVVALVHRHDCAHCLMREFLSTWHAMLVTKLPPVSGILFIAVTAMGFVAFHVVPNCLSCVDATSKPFAKTLAFIALGFIL
jgi:hypothetical protein